MILAFDVYGTLIDTAGVTVALKKHVGENASSFSNLWREKQLEYSFRRGLMQNYRDFSVCTRDALRYTARVFDVNLPDKDIDDLMAGYRILPAFSDAPEALNALQQSGHRMFAFSNGLREHVTGLLENAGIGHHFEDTVSVDELKSFKPNPAVYCHLLRRADATGSEAWMISGNPFDVIGALSAGMKAAWIRRSPSAVFDPWEMKPTATAGNLLELAALLTS